MLDNCLVNRSSYFMNRLPIGKRAQIIQMLIEGNSLRATSRLGDVSINTITKLLVDVGVAAAEYHDTVVRDVRVRRLQCDQIWCFVGAKAKNVTREQKAMGWGDVWTWTAIDANTKLCLNYLVGGRDGGWARDFMEDCASRVRGRVQLTIDGHKAYLEAAEGGFGMDIDSAVLHKIYGAPSESEARRYSPAQCIGCDMKTVIGNPDPKHVGISFVERQNLTTRMGMRRFTRLTNGISKKLENHASMVALHFLYYNFGRIHNTLRATPAIEAGLANHVWSFEEIAELADSPNL
jgi:IS1 family transposase